ncbi:MAG: VOC family protein [Sulfitobacter sp.]
MSISAFSAIRAVDYTVVITRDMAAMRSFYEGVMGFVLERELSENWLEYRVGATILALSAPGLTRDDAPVPTGSAAVQLAFCVPVAAVDACAAELEMKGVAILSPPTDRDFGHRTLFFRDPDGNLIEIYAEI